MFAFPDMNHSFNMYTTLVEEFVNNGHDVTVIAPGNQKSCISIEKNIPILRVRTLPIKNVPNVLKGISNLLLPLQFEKALRQFYKGKSFELIISPTPPITLVSLASKLKQQYNAKFYLILRDIFPQNAVDLGFMKKGGLLHRYFREKEISLYKSADYIGCMSQGNIEYVLRHNPCLPSEKLHILRNYQKAYDNRDSDGEVIKRKYRVENRFTVVFGGNMGKPQQLENVIVLAQNAQKYKDIVFILIGEGVEMEKVAEFIQKSGLTNIVLKNAIPKDEYQHLLSVCDVGLISLHENFTIPNIPSKSLDYMNVGIPVLASIDKCTDFGFMINEAQCGLSSIAGDHSNFFKNLETLYLNKSLRIEMGKNGNNYFQKYLTPEIAYATILNSI